MKEWSEHGGQMVFSQIWAETYYRLDYLKESIMDLPHAMAEMSKVSSECMTKAFLHIDWYEIVDISSSPFTHHVDTIDNIKPV